MKDAWRRFRVALDNLGIFRPSIHATLERELNEIREMPIVVKIMFLRGSVDYPGLPFGGIICDLRKPPWRDPTGDPDDVVPIVGVPHATFRESVPWETIFAQRIH